MLKQALAADDRLIRLWVSAPRGGQPNVGIRVSASSGPSFFCFDSPTESYILRPNGFFQPDPQ